MEVESAQQLVGGIQLGGRVVVAADEHHLQCRVLGPQTCQEAVELLPGTGGRVGGVEQIARHQQGVNVAGLDCVGQPVEEGVVFEAAVVAVKLMTEVPVGGVQDLHGKRLDKEKRAGARAPRDGDKMRMEPPVFNRGSPRRQIQTAW